MSKIVKVIGREIIDSRGNPTVEAEVHGRWFRRYGGGSVRCFYWFPRSAGTARWRQIPFLGKGVTKAVGAVNGPIAQAILGKDAKDRAGIDKIMIDRTVLKTNLTSVQTPFWLSLWLTPKLLLPLKVCRCTSTLLN